MAHISETMVRIYALFDKYGERFMQPIPDAPLHCERQDNKPAVYISGPLRRRILKLRRDGKQLKEIADSIGCSTTAVWNTLNSKKNDLS